MAKLVGAILLVCALATGLWYMLSEDSNYSNNAQANTTQSGMFGRGLYANNGAWKPGQEADPEYQIRFPIDHAEHTNFDIEWWYLTANLRDKNNKVYGLQWTLFRFRNPSESALTEASDKTPSWNNQQIYMAHASVHSIDNHWFGEKFARGGVGNAGVLGANNTSNNQQAFSLFIDNWRWENNKLNDSEKMNNQGLLPATLAFNIPLIKTEASGQPNEHLEINLQLNQSGPYVFHGENGFSIKSGEQQHASHYYSAPFIDVSGTFTMRGPDGQPASTKTISGQAWFDQEWTSQLLDSQTAGWDWISLHLDDGSKLMAFRMRLNDQDDYITGSLISPNGELRTLLPADISLIPKKFVTVNDKNLPLTWQLSIPSSNIEIEVSTIKEGQWNPSFLSYYEGMVAVSGTHNGEGFLELTGY